MDDVKEFSNELNSLYNVKPPISRAKMTSITRLALKSLKHYKHVVQSIEKFIHKCQAEYKLPGLYVIDSIVRQSRHQYGADKDPFASRFSRNIAVTFHDLLTCPPQEICKIVRVLNLWQKNSMFPPQIIQPLLDMAASPTSQEVYTAAQKAIQQVTGFQPCSLAASHPSQGRISVDMASASDFSGDVNSQPTDLLRAFSSQLLLPLLANPQLYLQLLQQQLLLQQATTGNMMPELQQSFVPQIDGNLMAQIQALTAALMARIGTSQQAPMQGQQSSNATAAMGLASNLDTTTDSLQSSDFHGDFTSPSFSNKKAGMSDVMSDNEFDKTADQMSVSSISTPAINTSEVPDGGLASGPAYSPSGDNVDGGQLVTSSTQHVPPPSSSESAPNMTPSTTAPSCTTSFLSEMSTLAKSSTHDGNIEGNSGTQKTSQKNSYNLFSPVSPINSVPNSPSEESGTPVLDEIPSPRILYSGLGALASEDKKNIYPGEQETDNDCLTSTNCHEGGLEEQTPEEGEILANEVEGDEETGSRECFSSYPVSGERHKRKRSKRSKEKRDRSKVETSIRNRDDIKRHKSKTEVTSKNKKEVKVISSKKEKDGKKKKRRNKERLSASRSQTDLGKGSRRSSISMADQTIIVDDKPRKYFVVLDELLPEPIREVKKSKRKRSPSPEAVVTLPKKVHVSRKDMFSSREAASRLHDVERQPEKRTRLESVEEMAKDKKKRKHSKEESHKSKHSASTKVDRAVQIPSSSNVVSNGTSSRIRSTSTKVEPKSSGKKSQRKESKHRRSHSRDKCLQSSSRTEKPAVKNRIYRAKSVSVDPIPANDRKSRSRSKDKRANKRKADSSKKSRQSPVRNDERPSSTKKELKSKSSRNRSEEEQKETKVDKTRTSGKEKQTKKQSSSSLSSSSSGVDKTECFEKSKSDLPPTKEKHACICSTTLWIGPISRHTKKEDLKKELHKYSKPTLVDVVTKQSCVYVAFETRREAVDLMHVLNDKSLCGKTVKVTWAPGSGIKQSKFLNRWDIELGVTYIPWDKLPSNMEAVSQGGELDASSMPPASEPISVSASHQKDKAESINTISPISLNPNNVTDDEPSKLSKKDEVFDENILAEIQLPSETKASEKDFVSSPKPQIQDDCLDKVVISEEELSLIALPPLPPPPPPPPINEVVDLSSSDTNEALPRIAAAFTEQVDDENDDDDLPNMICDNEGPSQILQNSVAEVIDLDQQVEEDINNKDIELPRNDSKSTISNKFSFSLESSSDKADKMEVTKKASDFDGEVESAVDDKASDVGACEDLQSIEVPAVKPGVEKKSNKTSKPEILKGKIKFGVISAFSGWANKHKSSVVVPPPVTVNNEEKQKEDARSLYETLMERINSKSKSSQQTGSTSTAVTGDKDFLNTIKVPSPKPIMTAASKMDFEKKAGDMSEAYDPFENYPDSGDNSPINKIMMASGQGNQIPALGPSPLSLTSSSIKTFPQQQHVGAFQERSYSTGTNNFAMPLYQQPSPSQNSSFAGHAMALPNVAPPTSMMMMMMPPPSNPIVPQHPSAVASSAPVGSKPFIGFVAPLLPSQSKMNLAFPQNPLIVCSNTASQVNTGQALSNTSYNPPVQSFSVPPPGMTINKPTNPLLYPPSDSSKTLLPPSTQLPSLPPNTMPTSTDIFCHPHRPPYSYVNMPHIVSSPVVCSASSQPYNAYNAVPDAIHTRRPPLLAKTPDDGVPHFGSQVSTRNSWPSGPRNPIPPPAPGSFPSIPQPHITESSRPCDWPRHPAPTSEQSQNAFSMKPKDFVSQCTPPFPGNSQNHLDRPEANDSRAINHQWEQSRKDNFVMTRDESADMKFSQVPPNSKSSNADLTSEKPRLVENMANELSQKCDNYQIPQKSGRFGANGEPIYKIESVISNNKLHGSDERELSLNSRKSFSGDSSVNPERLSAPQGLFNVPPPVIPQQIIRGNINALMAAPQRLPPAISGIMDARTPQASAIAQEFSKLLNSPVTFDGFSKNIPNREGIRLLSNLNLNSGFIQRPPAYNDGLLGPPPLNNFNPPNKVISERQPPMMAASLPNDFNRNLPPPLLPQQQVGMRNVLLPSPLDRAKKNSELRCQPPPLLNPGDFLNSLPASQRHETPHNRQMRFGDRDLDRRSINRDGGCPRFPQRPFDCPRGQKPRFGMETSRFNNRGGASRYN